MTEEEHLALHILSEGMPDATTHRNVELVESRWTRSHNQFTSPRRQTAIPAAGWSIGRGCGMARPPAPTELEARITSQPPDNAIHHGRASDLQVELIGPAGDLITSPTCGACRKHDAPLPEYLFGAQNSPLAGTTGLAALSAAPRTVGSPRPILRDANTSIANPRTTTLSAMGAGTLGVSYRSHELRVILYSALLSGSRHI